MTYRPRGMPARFMADAPEIVRRNGFCPARLLNCMSNNHTFLTVATENTP